MSLGEIRIMAANFAPQGWALCDGRTMQIQSNRNLFDRIKTTYGGDGRTTFLLPDLRGRAPMHRADGAALGTKGTIPVDAARSNSESGRVALNFIIDVADVDLFGQPYLGEVRPFGLTFAPKGWKFCDGALLPLAEYTALFTLLEKAFGGDGQRTFAVPNLQEAYPFQPNNPEERGRRGGAQVHDEGTPQQTPLLIINYCIAAQGIYPQR